MNKLESENKNLLKGISEKILIPYTCLMYLNDCFTKKIEHRKMIKERTEKGKDIGSST